MLMSLPLQGQSQNWDSSHSNGSWSALGKALLVSVPPPEPVLHQAGKDEKLSLEIWAGLATVKMFCTLKRVPALRQGVMTSTAGQYCSSSCGRGQAMRLMLPTLAVCASNVMLDDGISTYLFFFFIPPVCFLRCSTAYETLNPLLPKPHLNTGLSPCLLMIYSFLTRHPPSWAQLWGQSGKTAFCSSLP